MSCDADELILVKLSFRRVVQWVSCCLGELILVELSDLSCCYTQCIHARQIPRQVELFVASFGKNTPLQAGGHTLLMDDVVVLSKGAKWRAFHVYCERD